MTRISGFGAVFPESSERSLGFGPDAFLPTILERVGVYRASRIGPRCIFSENSRADWFPEGFGVWAQLSLTENSRADWFLKGFGVWAQMHFYREFSSGLVSKEFRGFGPDAFSLRILERIGF